MTLEEYIDRVEGFLDKKPSEQIPFFAYYLCQIEGKSSFTAGDISRCFDELQLLAYSNVSAYLSAQKKVKRFIKKREGGYVLPRTECDKIALQIGDKPKKAPSSALFPLSIFADSRPYILNTAEEVVICYDSGVYNACLVMIRKLIETLIIEVFERHGVQARIMTPNGNYLYCESLMDNLKEERNLWKISRNTAKALLDIKSKGDASAHNRHFNAQKSDVDDIKTGLRIALEELCYI